MVLFDWAVVLGVEMSVLAVRVPLGAAAAHVGVGRVGSARGAGVSPGGTWTAGGGSASSGAGAVVGARGRRWCGVVPRGHACVASSALGGSVRGQGGLGVLGGRAAALALARRRAVRVGVLAPNERDVSSSPGDDVEAAKRQEAERRRDAIRARARRRADEKKSYLRSAVGVTGFMTLLIGGALYYKFFLQAAANGTPVAYDEMLACFLLSLGGAVGMEFWARWAHKDLWHASLWDWHESHHLPREGLWEKNDVFAITNAAPAIGLMLYGLLNQGIVPGMAFGTGLGITIFGIAYMFVHAGLVHKRFPTGGLEEVPYLKRVAVAHQLHHTEKYDGVPWGLFLGPQELDAVGATAELDRLLNVCNTEGPEAEACPLEIPGGNKAIPVDAPVGAKSVRR